MTDASFPIATVRRIDRCRAFFTSTDMHHFALSMSVV